MNDLQARSLVVFMLLIAGAGCWGPKPNQTYTEVVIPPRLVPTRPTFTAPVPPLPPDLDPMAGQGQGGGYVIPEADGECPRNEDAAKFQGRVCMKKCDSDANCLSANRKCVCDGVCGMSCVKQDKECAKLKPPAHGRMKVPARLYGSVAKYVCREGYRLVGPSSRTCQADGRWTGPDPVCRENNNDVFCEGSPNITNARHNASYEQLTFDLNTTLLYSCYEGYRHQGRFAEAKCLLYNETAKWFGPDMFCEPNRCAPPRAIPNGRLERNCSQFLCRASYQCDNGFELIGRANSYCQSDGTWQPSELPTCQPVRCPSPPPPRHGRVQLRASTVASMAVYSCTEGFMLLGEPTRTCLPSKQWSGSDPICEAPSEIDCGMPGPLYNGWIGGNATSMNAQITFHCNANTVRVGQFESATCSSNGRWSHPLPKCMGPCELPRVSRGKVLNVTSPLVMHGENITVQCQPRYEMQLSHEMPVCYNGTWSHVPICVPARCKTLPPAPEEGFVIAPKNEHGSRAKYVCRDGYVLEGDNVTTCQYGNWTGAMPHCSVVYCSFPGDIANGSVLLVGNMGLYDYRSYVRKVRNDRMISFKCDRGFTLTGGPPGATCVDGLWRPVTMPKCSQDQHPALTTWFNKRSVRSTRSELARRVRRWIIDSDVGGGGSGRPRPHRRRRRRRRRRREPCEPIPQETYIRVEVVRVGKDSNVTYSPGTRVKVTCGHGYQLNIGAKLARCVRGRWRPEKPACVAMSCKLPLVEHGGWWQGGEPVASLDRIEHEARANLTCESGYTLQGTAEVTCWYGLLTSQPLECVPASCELPSLEDGSYGVPEYVGGVLVPHNATVFYRCENGLGGEAAAHCDHGELRPRAPSCRDRSATSLTADYAGIRLQLDELPDGALAQAAHYSVGSDILPESFNGQRRPCEPPENVRNSVVFREGLHAGSDNSSEKRYPDSTEITFSCVSGVGGERTSWKILCEDGHWVGRSFHCDENGHQVAGSQRNKSCVFRRDELVNVMTFFQDQPVLEKSVEFAAGTRLTFRCDDIGKFAMIGSTFRTCIGGDWDGAQPRCFGLNQMNDYALEKPPTILFRHKSGPIAQSNDGKLVVFPGAVLHLECLWIRKFGSPTWEVEHQFRSYPHGWTTEEGRDSNLEYRLSIYHAQAEDSGSYTCVTPPRHRHGVTIVVKAVHCPVVPERPGLYKSTHDTKMNSVVKFNCANGNTLIGAQQMTCLPSGNWSAPLPHCETIECPELRELPDPNIKVAILSRQVNGKVIFECPRGYQRVGAAEAYCQVNGHWSQPTPTCQELLCETPEVPEHGVMTPNTAKHMVGDVVQFTCHHGYMMDGQPIVECLENRKWSREIPKCVPACTYPGSTIGGTIYQMKFYYAIGELVTFACQNGLLLSGERTLECLPGGRWSASIPSCVGHL